MDMRRWIASKACSIELIIITDFISNERECNNCFYYTMDSRRLDWKLARLSGSNMVEIRDVTVASELCLASMNTLMNSRRLIFYGYLKFLGGMGSRRFGRTFRG